MKTEFDEWWDANTKSNCVADWFLGFGSAHGAAQAAWNEGMNRGAKYTNEHNSLLEAQKQSTSSPNRQIDAISLLRYLFYMRLPVGDKVEDHVSEEYAIKIHTLLSEKQH